MHEIHKLTKAFLEPCNLFLKILTASQKGDVCPESIQAQISHGTKALYAYFRFYLAKYSWDWV